MSYKISSNCVKCDSCRPQCPTGAIKVEDGQYSIDEGKCNKCVGYYAEPQCIISCPLSIPTPAQAKRGRNKLSTRTVTSPDLFADGKTNPLATAIVIWEACNLLAQGKTLPWVEEGAGELLYQRSVNQGRGAIALHIADNLYGEANATKDNTVMSAIAALDIRAACLHLIYAAYATTLDKPWEEEFIISDRQIEEYLGLEKRKDLSKAAKLTLIKELAQQPCTLGAAINWFQQGKVPAFSVMDSRLWEIVEIEHHFQEDDMGCKHLVGLTFKIRAGIWAKYFLNKQGCKNRSAFYQYGTLPKSLLTTIMSIWQQHEGAARLMLWLLFKTKMGREQRITIPTLLRIAYGEEKVNLAGRDREERKRLLRTFENDLEVLNHYGLKPTFDPVTYPSEIQPLWAKLADIPDDADEAMNFWINDACRDIRLTDAGPRGKWNRLMNARILQFELPADWHQEQAEAKQKKKQQTFKRNREKAKHHAALCGEQVVNARKNLRLSQRELAQMAGKSQSWIRDIENGRLRANFNDQLLLRQVLGLE